MYVTKNKFLSEDIVFSAKNMSQEKHHVIYLCRTDLSSIYYDWL